MSKEVSVFMLCASVQEAMKKKGFSTETIRRFEPVFNDFTLYSGNELYSQSLGARFLAEKLKELGGIPKTDKGSHLTLTYSQGMRNLAEYYNFGILYRRKDCLGEIVWPEPFRECTEKYFDEVVSSGLSPGYYTHARATLHDLILFLDARDVHAPEQIEVSDNDAFIAGLAGLSQKSIERRICDLRKYYRYLYLHEYISVPLGERLPKICTRGRMKFPTVWSQEDIEKIKASADRISPEGKRSYAMILLAAELGLRIGDIRKLKFSDIDWERKMITIVQHKTQQELCLPLPESVGWALIDYIKNGRPISNSRCVFVKHRPPYDEFSPTATLNYLLTKVLIKADIPADKKKQFGWHTFRRSLATNLLQNNVPMNTITEILGHNDPETAGQYYVQISTASLKPCILEVEVKDYVRN